MEGWAGVDGVMGGFGASRVGRAHLLANRRAHRIVLNPPRPIHHFGSFERSYRLYFLPCARVASLVTDLHAEYVFVFMYSRFNTCIWSVSEYEYK